MERVRDIGVGEPRPLLQRLRLFPGAVRVQETVFALPFAYTGMVLAADGVPDWGAFLWITVAMVGARTLGMSANRLIDRHIDALNPRTAQRHLPAGLLGAPDMAALALAAAAVFFFAAWRLNTLTLALAPVAGAYLVLYPYAKRFTWGANILLGWALAIAPSAAWIGVKGSLSWEPVLLSAAVAMWAGSFDILYHAQDVEAYARHGLHSVARRFGVRAAFRWSRTMDALAVAFLVATGIALGLSFPYYVGCLVAAGLMAYKHRMVSPDDLSRMDMAFFRVNAYVSATVLVSVVASLLVSG